MVCLLVLTQISLSAQSYKLPDYTTFKLPNGLTVFLMEQHDVPVISVSALIPAGAINDKDKSGLASLTATALKHGTKNFTKAKLDEELDFIGANVSTYASKEYSDFPPTLQLKIKTRC
jgi:predicted Zn-dependent peptidase